VACNYKLIFFNPDNIH